MKYEVMEYYCMALIPYFRSAKFQAYLQNQKFISLQALEC